MRPIGNSTKAPLSRVGGPSSGRLSHAPFLPRSRRSEERRVRKEGRSRWWPYHLKKKRTFPTASGSLEKGRVASFTNAYGFPNLSIPRVSGVFAPWRVLSSFTFTEPLSSYGPCICEC